MNDDVKERILRTEEGRAKVREEIEATQKELGIDRLVRVKQTDEFGVLQDLKDNASGFSEQMKAAEEKQAAEVVRRHKERAESVRPMSEAEYFRRKEAREKAEYERRRISL